MGEDLEKCQPIGDEEEQCELGNRMRGHSLRQFNETVLNVRE